MSEFGHNSAIIPGFGCIDSWGRGPFSIVVGRSVFLFEDSDRFGPALINKDGELKKNPYPGERSPFWRAHRIWVRQGRKVEADKVTCLWREPKPQIVRRIGRMCVIVDPGEDDGHTIEIKTIAPLDGADGQHEDKK